LVVVRRMMGAGVPPPPPPQQQQHHHERGAAVPAPPPPLPLPLLGRELANPPSDGISNLRFSNYSDHLLVSSWDTKVRLYDASANVLKGQFAHRAPVLDCCFHDDSSGFTASTDHTVYRYGALVLLLAKTLSKPFLVPHNGIEWAALEH
jgi:WD40 repeat protein